MLTDKQLIQKILQGNQHAFNHIVSKYQDYMYTVCYNILKTRAEAEEATQDTFVKAYKSLGKYQETAKFSSWLYKIAYRTSLDYIRKRKHTTDIDDVKYGLSDTTENVQVAMETSESSERIKQAIGLLDPKEAGMIRMFYLEEMSIKELSKATGQSLSNTKVILFRARKKLAAIVKQQFSDLEKY